MSMRSTSEWARGGFSNFHPGSPSEIQRDISMAGSWIPIKELPPFSKECIHDWHENILTSYVTVRANGLAKKPAQEVADEHLTKVVKLLMVLLKAKDEELARRIEAVAKERQKFESEKRKTIAGHANGRKEEEMIRSSAEKDEEIECLEKALRHYEERWADPPHCDEDTRKAEDSRNKPDMPQEASVVFNGEMVYNSTTPDAPPKIRRVQNSLYNFIIEFDIPNCQPFSVHAILDTGATSCYISSDKLPEGATDPISRPIKIYGLNSVQSTSSKLRKGSLVIGENKFPILVVYVLDVSLSDGVEMLLGANFIKNMQGGVRIEGNEVTFYKKVTTIRTTERVEMAQHTTEELEPGENESLEILDSIYFNAPTNEHFKRKFFDILHKLEQQGYIGEDPLKHWRKNGEVCKLELINPDVTIEDKPLKHVTPAMEASFKNHIDSLLKLGVIRPSSSRHRTMAMIVQKEIRGKERLVFNYRSLNDNTYKDQYSLPGINTILQRVGNAKIFSKFDLKSGFHQVAMDEESIPWTAFIVPEGLYKWLVMPFGLKNAPAVFQRKMDKVFKGTEGFIAMYIDDILVFSNNEKNMKSTCR
ncbi:hypothetical protein OSB04_023641 [Centaurea solstitialis]|uniref:Reverse transcriptase domain-containing protein n=1 Tax=Centaurea solstitialis TaxID=347529 RepID=A0AA38WBB1_9ASTR|nr:hypothetical protein OSB04_023641 [Centaurea solstitialis]